MNDPDVGQGQNHERGQHTANYEKGTAASVPEPHFVADNANDHLANDPGDGSGGPYNADFVDLQPVLRTQNPAQRSNLHRERKPHSCSRKR